MSEAATISHPESSKAPFAPSHKTVFYGWWIVIGGMAIMTVSSGIGFFGHALILDPLRAEFGWSKGTVSSAVTLFLFMAAVTGSIVGGKIDKYGPSPVLVLGSLFMGSGFVLLGQIKELWHLYAVYILLAVGWGGIHLLPVSTLIANWFVKKRGLAMSVAMTGMSLGGVIIVPAAGYLLRRMGLRASLPFFGFVFWAVILPIAIFVIKKRPADMGLTPDGERPSEVAAGKEEVPLSFSAQMKPWTRRQALGTKAFWAIVFAFFLVFCGQVTFMIHGISFLSPLLGPAGAAASVSVMTGASFFGRLLVGSCVDRLDKRFAAFACFLLQGGAVLVMAHSHHTATLYLCVIAFGLTMGNVIMLLSLIIGEYFGTVSFGRVSGLAMLFTISGSAFGPMIAGILFDLTRSYSAAFTLFALTYAIASVIILFTKPPVRTT